MRVMVLAALTACGPGLANAPKQSAREALAGNAARYEELVRGGVTNGGLWFDDPACAAKFGKPGPVAKADLAAFARCLAALHLQPSTREDALGDVVVMSYGPFEIEARVVPETSGPRLTWIGYEAQASEEDRLPTLSSSAIEKLRIDGTRDGPIEPAVAAQLELDIVPNVRAAFTWVKFCVDESGAVTTALPYETTSVRAQDAAVLAVRAWKFKPFEHGGQPVPVCSLARIVYPTGALLGETIPVPPPASHGKQPPLVFAAEPKALGRRVAGTMQLSPDGDTRHAMHVEGKTSLSGRFRVCIDETGKVDSVLPLRSTGYAAFDRKLIAGMRGWAFTPFQKDGASVPVCAATSYEYQER